VERHACARFSLSIADIVFFFCHGYAVKKYVMSKNEKNDFHQVDLPFP